MLKQSYERFLAHYQDHPQEAEQLLEVGDAPQRISSPEQRPQVAALTAVCNGLFNLDEALTKE